jgi:hypothetical protein
MIHEILLALAGHESKLFEQSDAASLPLLTAPENELLKSISRKAFCHRSIRSNVDAIVSSNRSPICRAVATSIRDVHLARFKQKILEVESGILKRDAGVVGAYNIVPLAWVVVQFDEWTRALDWLDQISSSMADEQMPLSGAALIDKLRNNAHTGYANIEAIAKELTKTAERAWLQQLSGWMMSGRLPLYDFFITESKEISAGESRSDNGSRLELVPKEQPWFLATSAALDALFVGKMILLARERREKGKSEKTALDHIERLSMLAKDGITEANITATITAMRKSLCEEVLCYVLPIDKVVQLLELFHLFFLLGKGEFAMTLIEETQTYIKVHKALALVKDADAKEIMNRTWHQLANSVYEIDDTLDQARRIIRLTVHEPPKWVEIRRRNPLQKHEDSLLSYHETLLAQPTYLVMDCASPLDLFVSSENLRAYSIIHAYLLSIRRSQILLSDLWRQDMLRRPKTHDLGIISQIEERRIWATCRSALFFLSETGAYFEGEVIQRTWAHYISWILLAKDVPVSASVSPAKPTASTITAHKRETIYDPGRLANAHTTFLTILQRRLLFSTEFPKVLHGFLRLVDTIAAVMGRLPYAAGTSDRASLMLELDRCRKKLDSNMKALMNLLRAIDESTGPGGINLEMGASTTKDDYVPGRVGGVDRLLMKLDFGAELERENLNEPLL